MKISVLCAAGASSTFAALHLRREAAARGLAATITVSTLPAVLLRPDDSDVILLGAHLSGERDRVRLAAPDARVVQLGTTITDRAQAAAVLDSITAEHDTARGGTAPQNEGHRQ
ncbi:hypothetical protein [Mycetocola reblochoni]|uniref:PTS EIIB type-3 domain-containing protein n=2 Tax=Mycetocola reblochoni TaxID=331618 RepID=A0A1R4I8N9_9MICO|nr:hypothetical protein [Mycetocola reblochoni]SJN16251.1 hypothetical protein FM119_00420 [Mycetocola reblochoni REB411]